jgi:hypothetical protein
MDPRPEWLEHYERAYPSGLVARQILRPPKPDSYRMFTRLIEVVQEQQDSLDKQSKMIEDLSSRIKALEGKP